MVEPASYIFFEISVAESIPPLVYDAARVSAASEAWVVSFSGGVRVMASRKWLALTTAVVHASITCVASSNGSPFALLMRSPSVLMRLEIRFIAWEKSFMSLPGASRICPSCSSENLFALFGMVRLLN
jgi:hypothetical protein